MEFEYDACVRNHNINLSRWDEPVMSLLIDKSYVPRHMSEREKVCERKRERMH